MTATTTGLDLTGHWLTPDRGRPLLVVGPSLGTGVVALWAECAEVVGRGDQGLDVLGWELPGHGDGASVTTAFSLEDVARSVVSLVDRMRPGATFVHAGVSVAGTVGLVLAVGRALRAAGQEPGRIRGSAVICSGARIGSAEAWAERADLVRRAGTTSMVEGSSQRWFAPGFLDRAPRTASALLTTLEHADSESYARVCEALGRADLRADLPSLTVPVMVMGGRHDPVVDPESQQRLASAIPGSTLVIVEEASHLAPAECPVEVAELLASWAAGLFSSTGNA